ncbi:MAG: hypothetical protein ACRD1T_11105, partial [Acidimicrobiia bacterium]
IEDGLQREVLIMWGKIKKAAKKVWNGAKSLWKQAWNVVNEAWNRIPNLPTFFATLFGWKWPMKCRLRIVILRDESGVSLLGKGSSDDVQPSPIPFVSPEAEAQPALDLANAIYKRYCNLTFVAARGGPIITVAQKPAPTAALDVDCNWGAWTDELGGAGDYFRSLAAEMWGNLPFGYGAPITVFVVRSIAEKSGCSLGPMTAYVTVEAGAMRRETPRTLAHEVGHAFGLPHNEVLIGPWGWNNLMEPGGIGLELNRLQQAVVRTSPHATTL